MKLGILFSGGKDSAYALYKAMEKDDVVCLISMISKNDESYMFHIPNIGITDIQAEAIGLPLIQEETKGVKEEELKDLKNAIKKAKSKYKIEGVVTGAIASEYQAKRVRKICAELELVSVNPLWQKDQKTLLEEIVENKFDVMITGIFAYPLDETWLGRRLDAKTIEDLNELKRKFGMNPAGEGGEIETTVLDAPFFKKKVKILEHEINAGDNEGIFVIKKAKLVNK
ncbi:MAG: TIGR00289 family protein [Candidatus Aenigmarchaeota archaeon]|nr:TIGR00289 family protein [Candidatus Aenigmarchaeota archaeon]